MAEPNADLLAQSEERFRLLVASIRDYAIFMLDPSGRITTWNEGAERIKGYRADEIIGRHFSLFYSLDDVAAGMCENALAIAEREGRFEREGRRVRKDGTTFLANVVITALRDESGRLIGFAKVTRDLTERHRADEQRLRLARAEEAQQRRDEFLAMLGHELRNPLAPVLLATEVLKARRPGGCEREIAVLDRQVRHMKRLLDDLADASRVLHHDVELELAPLEIRDALTVPLDMLGPLATEHGQTVLVEVAATGLPVLVDAARMGQVFGNVLRNASKYTPDGGHIVVSAVDRGDAIEVEVTDTGRGISADTLEHIFDVFTQGEHGLGGLGVGLAVARRIVRAHGGDITASSRGLGRGACFVIRLPKVEASAVPASAPTRATPVPHQRVLVVDDNEDAADLTRRILEASGHTVIVATDGREAIEAYAAAPADIVFLDVGLPVMTGYEVAAALRAMPGGTDVPIIAVTGYATPSDRARAEEAGFTTHLAKPVAMSDLLDMIRRYGLGRA